MRYLVIVAAIALLPACASDQRPQPARRAVAPAKSPTEASLAATPAAPTPAREPSTVSRYVTQQVQERIAPRPDAASTNTLSRQQRVEVYETKAGWARVSPYYEGSIEGTAGRVARWLPLSSLSASRPPDLPQPVTPNDPRIAGLPKVGEGGLTTRDVQVLHAAAAYFLESGKAKHIEYGDKSTSRPGTYYLNFGGPTNTFFRPDEVPGLEERIERQGQ